MNVTKGQCLFEQFAQFFFKFQPRKQPNVARMPCLHHQDKKKTGGKFWWCLQGGEREELLANFLVDWFMF